MEDKLIVESSVTHVFSINETIGCVVTGNLNDAKAVITRMRMYCAEFKFKNEYNIPVSVLVAKCAE